MSWRGSPDAKSHTHHQFRQRKAMIRRVSIITSDMKRPPLTVVVLLTWRLKHEKNYLKTRVNAEIIKHNWRELSDLPVNLRNEIWKPVKARWVGHDKENDDGQDDVECWCYEKPGLVSNAILFCWLFKIKHRCKKVRFQLTHNQAMCQLFLTVSLDLRVYQGTSDSVLDSL